jgi:hypothetical protein
MQIAGRAKRFKKVKLADASSLSFVLEGTPISGELLPVESFGSKCLEG